MPAAFFSETVKSTAIKLGTLTRYLISILWCHNDVIGCHVYFMAAILDFLENSKTAQNHPEIDQKH